jgi:hypothetical protein
VELGQAFFGNQQGNGDQSMRVQSMTSLVVLLLSPAVATSAIAAQAYTGCPAGYHRAEAEGGGVGSLGVQTRKAEAEGGGVGSVGMQTRKAEAEGGGVGSLGVQTRKAEAEGGGVGSVGMQTRKAAALDQMPCVPN